jgi:hypothetical protein
VCHRHGDGGDLHLPALKRILRLGRDALIVALITLALGELALRIYNFIHPLPIFYTNSYDRFRGKPFSPDWNFHLNSKGFKDVEFNTRKAAGTTRILGIGDSFAFGVVPYEYNYLTLVEQYLNQSGHRVELINMGIPGTGPFQYLSLLADEGLQLEPDSVLLSFFIGNDFYDERRSRVSYSYVASLIKYLLDRRTKIEGQIVHGGGAYDDNEPFFTDDAFFELELRFSGKFLRRNPAFEGVFSATLPYITEIKTLCDSRNIGLTIVLIPDEAQVSRPLQTQIVEASGLGPEYFDFALPNKLLHARFEELKIDYLDLTPEFSSRSLNGRLYRPNDSHWNIAGNELAARLIFQHLSAQLH